MVVSVKEIKDFFLLLDHSLDAAKLEANGENFYFTEMHLTKLRRFNKEFTVPKPNDLSVSLKALTDELLRGTDTIPVFLSYIKMLYKQRWETTLQRCDASEILNASLTNSLWIALTDGFEALLGRAFALNLISEQQYKKMPLVLRAGVLELDTFELFYPGLKRHYELSIDSYKADTGFFWMPDLKDLKPDSNSYLPVRLYKPSEEVLLRKNYGPGLAGYLDYFVTSERSEPPIMRETFEKLRGLVEEALLFEYTVTRDTHLDEIRQLIGRQTENEWLNEKAVAIKEHLPKIKDSLKSLSEEDPKKEQLAKYIRFREAGTYDSNYEIVGDLKKVLLVACSVREKVDVSVLEELMSQAVSRKLANLTSAEIFSGEKDLQDEKLNEFTKKFVEKLSAMEGWPGGRAEMKRLRNQVLHLEGIPIDNQVMTYATFGRLVYLMAPSNQVASACAHTIWRSFLLGLMTDYMPERRFDERLERRFDGRLEDEIGLPEMRERSRNRAFYAPVTAQSCFASIAARDSHGMRLVEDSPNSSQRASPYNILMEVARMQSGKDSIRRSRSLETFLPVPVPGKV